MNRLTRLTAVLTATFGLTACAEPPGTVLEQLLESRRLATEMRLHFSRMLDAGNRAVMADTTDAASAAARELDEAIKAVQHESATLATLLDRLDFAAEARLLQEFRPRFDELQALDREILALAAIDSNLNAQRLAFGPAAEAADAAVGALARASGAARIDDWRLRATAAETIAAIREIQALEGPHFPEADDAVMTRLEARMATAEQAARSGLAALAIVTPAGGRAHVAAAADAFARFLTHHAEALKLSRQNSNVRSLGLSLGRRRTLAASCEEPLRALQDALAARDLGPRR